jgi:hypothetical protein
MPFNQHRSVHILLHDHLIFPTQIWIFCDVYSSALAVRMRLDYKELILRSLRGEEIIFFWENPSFRIKSILLRHQPLSKFEVG